MGKNSVVGKAISSVSDGFDKVLDARFKVGSELGNLYSSKLGSQLLTPGLLGFALYKYQDKQNKADQAKKDAAAEYNSQLTSQVTNSQEIDDQTRSQLLSMLGSGNTDAAASLFSTALNADPNSVYKMRLAYQRYVQNQQNTGQTQVAGASAAGPSLGSLGASTPGLGGNPWSTAIVS